MNGDDGNISDAGGVGDASGGDDLTTNFDVFSSHYPAYLSPELDVPTQVSSTQLPFEQSSIAIVDPCLLQLSPSFDHSVNSSENGRSQQNFVATFDPLEEPPLPLISNTESHSELDVEGIDIDIADLLAPYTNIESSCPNSDSPSSVARSTTETIRCDFPECPRVFQDRRRLKYNILYLLILQ
jgi:hypothetical protein